jgi:sporulation protein YlmC with PRC-barrel domain
MTDIPLDAKVFCSDGEAGKTTAVIIDPIKQKITHVVVNHNYEDLIVPLEKIIKNTPDSITLSCTTTELSQMPSFTEVHYLDGGGYYPDYADAVWASPYVTAYPAEDMPIIEEMLPAGELAIHRGDPVLATDGQVGHVEEFIVDAESGHITHLVLRSGHFWGKHDVTISLKNVEKVEEGLVYLNVNKNTVEKFPSVKVKRHYPWEEK